MAMTRDDITRMAQEAGFVGFDGDTKCLREFAFIVAAAEREACALVCLMPVDEIQITGDCREYIHKDYLDCAEAIRARGNT
jgi:DNA-binding IclR family transcriptional regulator